MLQMDPSLCELQIDQSGSKRRRVISEMCVDRNGKALEHTGYSQKVTRRSFPERTAEVARMAGESCSVSDRVESSRAGGGEESRHIWRQRGDRRSTSNVSTEVFFPGPVNLSTGWFFLMDPLLRSMPFNKVLFEKCTHKC